VNIALLSSAAFAASFVGTSKAAGPTPSPEPALHELDEGEILKIPQPLRLEVVCLRGSLWITHDGDPKDIMVEAGGCYRVDRPSTLLIHALLRARLEIRALPADCP